jgi:hypothetical protein
MCHWSKDWSSFCSCLNRLWPIYFSKHLVHVGEYIVVLGARALLPLFEVFVVALILVKLDEPLIGSVYLVSLQPNLLQRGVDRALSACRGAISVQG